MGCRSSRNRRVYHEGLPSDAQADVDEFGVEIIPGGDMVRQKVALHHVVNDIFLYAPVKVSNLSYPKNHPQSGEHYLWVVLDSALLDRQAEQSGQADTELEKNKNSYPLGVSIDANGNCVVAAADSSGRRTIEGDDIMAAFKVPVLSAPPRVKSTLPESVVLAWDRPLGLVDKVELQYRLADRFLDNVKWTCAQCSFDNKPQDTECDVCKHPYQPTPPASPMRKAMPASGTGVEGAAAAKDAEAAANAPKATKRSRTWEIVAIVPGDECSSEVQYIECQRAYVFRFRAHNRTGWSEFGPVSNAVKTSPERPGVTEPPVCVKTLDNGFLLSWPQPASNGRPITSYTLKGGLVSKGEHEVAYEGSNPYVLLRNYDPKQECHFQVAATNALGDGAFSEYAKFRTAVKGSLDDALERCAWCEVDVGAQRKVYVNVQSGKTQTERPGELDGPVDKNLEFKKKRFRFLRTLLRGAEQSPIDVTRLNVERLCLLEDSVDQVLAIESDCLAKRIKVEYAGEEGIDSGGLSKDWFLEVSRLLVNKEEGLFAPVGTSGLGFNTNAPLEPHMADRMFFFVGRFLGKAIFDRQLVDLRFSTMLRKQILGHTVVLDDIRALEPEMVKSMEWMIDNDIDDIIFETFSVEVPVIQPPVQEQQLLVAKESFQVSRTERQVNNNNKARSAPPSPSKKATTRVVDLIEGGRNIEVTNDNKLDYVEKLLEYKVNGCVECELAAFRRGFHDIVPADALAEFDVDELDMLWNGRREVDVTEIRAGAVYQGGFDANTLLVHWFWALFKELDNDVKGLLVRFVTGTPKIPLDGYVPPFNLTSNPDMSPEALPKAHTCFNQLVLPPYVTKQQLKDKLLFAVRNSEGFLLG